MRIPHLFAATALGAIALAACRSSGSYSSSATSPTTNPAPATTIATTGTTVVKTATTSLGSILVDTTGLTLYGLTKDTNGTSTCVDACASAWPPLIVDGSSLPTGLDPAVFSVTTRPDGSHQLKAGKWPLYRFAGDAAAGDTNGEGSGGVWFVVTPTGALHKT